MPPSHHFHILAGCLIAAGFSVGVANAQAPALHQPPAAPLELLLASQASASTDPAGYLVSEKFDGVRALWDGRTLRFRSGREIPAPRWFVQHLPAIALDGELWLARGRFDALSGIVRSESAVDADWRQIQYIVFELPGAAGPFAERAAQIERIVDSTGWPQLKAARQQTVSDRAALDRLFRQTIASGGEGLMLHRASTLYQTGRSDALVKLKPQRDDEAVVINHRAGKGKYAGALGAIQLRASDGRQFWVGSGFSDDQRRNPPALGSTVTYRYRDLTSSGLPRFATFVRILDTF
ncbi:MAG: DNA ligase [Ideonella sp.]